MEDQRQFIRDCDNLCTRDWQEMSIEQRLAWLNTYDAYIEQLSIGEY